MVYAHPLSTRKVKRKELILSFLRKTGICVSTDRFLLVRVKTDLTNNNRIEPELLFLVEFVLLLLTVTFSP